MLLVRNYLFTECVLLKLLIDNSGCQQCYYHKYLIVSLHTKEQLIWVNWKRKWIFLQKKRIKRHENHRLWPSQIFILFLMMDNISKSWLLIKLKCFFKSIFLISSSWERFQYPTSRDSSARKFCNHNHVPFQCILCVWSLCLNSSLIVSQSFYYLLKTCLKFQCFQESFKDACWNTWWVFAERVE